MYLVVFHLNKMMHVSLTTCHDLQATKEPEDRTMEEEALVEEYEQAQEAAEATAGEPMDCIAIPTLILRETLRA